MINEERAVRMVEAVARVLQRLGHSCDPDVAAAAARECWARGGE